MSPNIMARSWQKIPIKRIYIENYINKNSDASIDDNSSPRTMEVQFAPRSASRK